MDKKVTGISRRQFVQATGALGISLAAAGSPKTFASSLSCEQVICRTIPGTNEVIPSLGVGTNRFGQAGVAVAKELLARMYEKGGRVIDTAARYGDSESVIGEALAALGLRDEMFVATKFDTPGAQFRGPAVEPGPNDISAEDSFKRSLERLQMDRVDLLFAHFVSSVEPTMPLLLDLKEKGLTRYIGITSIQREQHAQVMQYMRDFPIDFLQIDYSIGNRDSAKDVLPLAEKLGIAVMVAVPFGGRRNSMFSDVSGTPVPDWANEFGVETWGQFFLKYVVSHPAVTCVIPGTTDLKHMTDNQAAGLAVLPTADQRARMERYWDEVSGSA